MASWQKVILLVVLCLQQETMADCNSDGESCNQCFPRLATLLINTSDNTYQLRKAFFPPRGIPPAFVKVTYQYISNISNTSHSNQTWFWSSTAFYLIQPLQVFTFTSLLFGLPSWRKKDVVITLPEECENAPEMFMELLTQMVSTSFSTL